MPTPIRKALISAFGDASNVSVVDDVLADPPAKHVQVEVLYAGFAGSDVNMRRGTYPMQRKAPLTPGYSLVGRVVAVGPQSSGAFSIGDIVGAVTVYDAQATRCNVAEKYCVAVPDGVRSLQQACALALDWATAYGMVTRAAAVAPGQRVFVHGLSGAVGMATLALAQRAGATVYGTASARNHAALRARGAIPFVYTDRAWVGAMQQLGGAHAVFDPLGFDSWDASYSILTKDGILVGYGGNANALASSSSASPSSSSSAATEKKDADTASTGGGSGLTLAGLPVWPLTKLFARGLLPCTPRTSFYFIDPNGKFYRPDFVAVLDLLARGEIEPQIKSVHELEDIRRAHDAWGKAEGMGSMLIRVGGSE